MLVDDEYMILEGLKYLLPWEELGFEIVQTARNAKEALAYLSENTIDLLITDITMPEMTGIEMVEAAQKEGHQFATIILSGYQEFEYAKKSMQLGVKNYLVKPVDKAELLATVKEVKEIFVAQKQRQEQRQTLIENHLVRWMNDELNDQEFEELLEWCALKDEGPYTVIQIEAEVEPLQHVVIYLSEQKQSLVVANWLVPVQKILWVFQGGNESLQQKIKQLETVFPNQLETFIGEPVTEWENVYKSYDRIKQMVRLKNFYPDLIPENRHFDKLSNQQIEQSLLSFNQSLMIGDAKTIKQVLTEIFIEIRAHHYDPESARYLSFFLFADISRQYPQAKEDIYEQALDKIRNSQTIDELQTLLETILIEVKAYPEVKQYSEIVGKIVAMVKESYREDLNLKAVADEMHLNVVYLGQLFKKETQSSFSQYLNQVRIRQAQQLLLYTQDTVNEISDEVGYNNTNYFSKMFKKLNGITPKEFREQYTGNYTNNIKEG